MKKLFSTALLVVSTPLITACAQQSGSTAHTVEYQKGSNVEVFWQEYAGSKGGLTFGATSTYPDYDKVNEGDTILIQLEQGSCLMEFYHSAWRRANDVWRWDEDMNNFGGCPYVFD
ncbi:hypothetical protein ACFSJY_07445 [Thalassotalea euphylliae]|uniref:hypothetical protein n=1 Tax=Thalassotalea euphylliae TaxID=1655234 RepID=UPI003642DA92